jgi:glycosyltransferase involved in cell wall biosynthesis
MPRFVPLYRLLAQDPRLRFTVVYASSGGVRPADAGYSSPVAWDVDLLSGYDSIFLKRAHTNPIGGFGLRDLDVVPVLRRLRPEVFWQFGYDSLTHLLAASTERFARVPILFGDDQTLLHRRPAWKQALKRPLLGALFANQRALYVGTENRRWFEKYGVQGARMFYVPYACDDALQADAARLALQKDRVRADFGIEKDAGPVVLTVSRLIDKKQPLMVLEAFSQTRARIQCSLLVVGTGRLEPAMREKVEAEHIPDVVFAGFINQSRIARAYAAGDVFVLMSRIHETWGMVVNEAMTFQLPLVVSDKVGCAADLVLDGANGYVVPFDSTELLAERMTRLVSEPATRLAFGKESGRLVASHSYPVAAAGLLAAISDAVGPGRWMQGA